MIRASVLFLVLVAVALGVASRTCAEPPRKQLAGPPSEFAAMALPQPIDGALAEASASQDVYFKLTQRNTSSLSSSSVLIFSHSEEVVVDSAKAFMLTVLVPVPEGSVLSTTLSDPSGNAVDLSKHMHKGMFPIGGMHVPETTYTFESSSAQSFPAGVYTLSLELSASPERVSAADLARLSVSTGIPHGVTIVWNDSPVQMHAHLNTYQLITDSQVGLVARMTDDATILDGVAPSALRDIVYSAKIDITLPDGKEMMVDMHDDGLHGDFEANDGIFAGSFAAAEVGKYTMRGILEGVLADGKTRFRRTTEHLMPISSLEVQMSGSASGSWSRAMDANSNDKLVIAVKVEPRAEYQRVDRKFRAYAQVWGKSSSGADVPVAWISQMVNINGMPESDTLAFSLTLDGGWVSAASAVAPFELRQVVLQDSSNYVPETELATIPVTLAADADHHFTSIIAQRPLTLANMTLEWRQGRNPLPLTPRQLGNPQAQKVGLVLLHGYCSADNPWEKQKADWQDGFFFLNPKASIGNDEFALKVTTFVENTGLDSFGLVGHSQGGMVSAHLFNYYFTGLDHSEGSRRIQSVGSPYQGCSAAGSIANLGKVFGVGCGENLDLSKDSARLWGAGISSHIKNELYYYTTTYVQGKLFGDWCSLAMNAILQYPNDGTAELTYEKFDGAHNMGNTEKQCHTTEMGYPPQYWDQQRNAVLSKNAAR